MRTSAEGSRFKLPEERSIGMRARGKRYSEVIVTKRKFAGRRVSEVEVGERCTVVLVFRDGRCTDRNPTSC